MNMPLPAPFVSNAVVPPRPCPSPEAEWCVFDDTKRSIDRSKLIGEVGVARCRHCGIGVSHPPLADVAFLYADRSSEDFQPGTSRVAHAIKSVAFRLQARSFLKQVGGNPRRIVDFGCGSGLFTRQLGKALPAAVVIGTDFHDRPPDDLTEYSYQSFDRLDELEGSADVVLARHVLEHDDDPEALLKRIAGVARPGGKIVLEVPNVDCIWAVFFGSSWHAWYLPYHRVHFSRTALRGLVQAAGFVVERELSVCVPTMGRTMANLLGRRNSLAFILLGAALHPIQWLGERLTRRPAALRLVARLPG